MNKEYKARYAEFSQPIIDALAKGEIDEAHDRMAVVWRKLTVEQQEAAQGLLFVAADLACCMTHDEFLLILGSLAGLAWRVKAESAA